MKAALDGRSEPTTLQQPLLDALDPLVSRATSARETRVLPTPSMSMSIPAPDGDCTGLPFLIN